MEYLSLGGGLFALGRCAESLNIFLLFRRVPGVSRYGGAGIEMLVCAII